MWRRAVASPKRWTTKIQDSADGSGDDILQLPDNIWIELTALDEMRTDRLCPGWNSAGNRLADGDGRTQPRTYPFSMRVQLRGSKSNANHPQISSDTSRNPQSVVLAISPQEVGTTASRSHSHTPAALMCEQIAVWHTRPSFIETI